MRWRSVVAAVALVAGSLCAAGAALAQGRVALVIGNAAYRNAPPLRTPIADAGLVAETMRAAGYDVTALNDVPAADIGQVMRDFLDKVAEAGPDTVAFFYFAGYAVQAGADNFLIPVDAQIQGEADVEAEAFRLSDLLSELAETQAAARVVVIDGAREHGFGRAAGRPIAPGLALVDPPAGTLVAFAAAPGAVAVPDGGEESSVYTAALVGLLRQPGLEIEQIFRGVRIEVNEATQGQQTPWMQSALENELVLFEAPAGVQTAIPNLPPRQARVVRRETFGGMPAAEAYRLVIEQDTLEAYQWFVELYPRSEHAAHVWDIIALRREAILWRRTLMHNTPRAYWNYLRRYPNGRYAAEARWRLADLNAPELPPPNYVVEPEPLPPDYYDEGIGVAEIVPEGSPPPPAVFFASPPAYFAPPPPPRVVRVYRSHNFRPPRAPAFVSRPVRIVARPPRVDRGPSRGWVRPAARTGRPVVRPPRVGVAMPPSRAVAPRPVGRPGAAGRARQPGVAIPPRGAGAGAGAGQPRTRPLPSAGRPRGAPGAPTGGRPGQPTRAGRVPPTPQGAGAPRTRAATPAQPPAAGPPPRAGRVPAAGQPRTRAQPTGQPPGAGGPPPRAVRVPPAGQPPSARPAARSAPPPRPAGTPPTARPAPPSRPATVAPRPAAPPSRPAAVAPRPTAPPARPAAQPPRPAAAPPRPAAVAPRPAAPPPARPAAAPPRPAAAPPRPATSQGSCPPGQRMVAGRCSR